MHRFLSTLSLRRATYLNRALAQSEQFLSTLSLRRATPEGAGKRQPAQISIHALLAESDRQIDAVRLAGLNFYPRSPCGERHGGIPCDVPVIQFLSTLSLRRATAHGTLGLQAHQRFLSTLSLRRATHCADTLWFRRHISIHALLAESDIIVLCGLLLLMAISIHALLAESDKCFPFVCR